MYRSSNWEITSDDEPEQKFDKKINELISASNTERLTRSQLRASRQSQSKKESNGSDLVKMALVNVTRGTPVRRSNRTRTPSRACSEAASMTSLPGEQQVRPGSRSRSRVASQAASEVNSEAEIDPDDRRDETLTLFEKMGELELKSQVSRKRGKSKNLNTDIVDPDSHCQSSPVKISKSSKTPKSQQSQAKPLLKTPVIVKRSLNKEFGKSKEYQKNGQSLKKQKDKEATKNEKRDREQHNLIHQTSQRGIRYTTRNIASIRAEQENYNGSGSESSSDSDNENDFKRRQDKLFTFEDEEIIDEEFENDNFKKSNKENFDPEAVKSCVANFEKTDRYFNAMKSTTKSSSKNNMSQLKKLDTFDITKEDVYNLENFNKLHRLNCSKFEEMLFYMMQNFNILLYGLGSKFKLLQDFIKTKYLEEAFILEINCFTNGPTISGMTILKELLVELLQVVTRVPKNPQLQIELLNSLFFHKRDAQNCKISKDCKPLEGCQLSSPEKKEIGLTTFGKISQRIILVVHNIDLIPKSKTSKDSNLCCMPHSYDGMGVLARLVQYDNVHLIASTDSIDSGLIFSSELLSYFNFINFRVSNPYSKYNLEVRSMGHARDTSNSGILLNAIINIYHSLTKNAQKIFEIIINYNIDQRNLIANAKKLKSSTNRENKSKMSDSLDDENINLGIDLDDLYSKAKKAFVVNNLQTLKNLLIEFRDHKLIYSEKGDRQGERILLRIDGATVDEFKSSISK